MAGVFQAFGFAPSNHEAAFTCAAGGSEEEKAIGSIPQIATRRMVVSFISPVLHVARSSFSVP
jgi:hypothetical protein